MKTVSQAGFASMAGVARQTIYNMTKADSRLYETLVGKKINIDHPIAITYIQERNEKRGIKAGTLPPPPTPSQKHNLPEEYLNMTLEQILKEFGTDEQFLDWLKATKTIEDVREKRLKNSITQGELIKRDFVQGHVFSYIENSQVRLLTDTPRTIAIRVLEAVKAGQTKEELEDLIREMISAPIKQVKGQVEKAFRNA